MIFPCRRIVGRLLTLVGKACMFSFSLFLLLVSVVRVLVRKQDEGVGWLVYCIMKRALRMKARINTKMMLIEWRTTCVIGAYVTREVLRSALCVSELMAGF